VEESLQNKPPEIISLSEDKLNQLAFSLSDDLAGMTRDREQWLDKFEHFICDYMDFDSPNRSSAWEGAANVHVPLALQQGRGFHARLVDAVLGPAEPFYLKTRDKADASKKQRNEKLMLWVLENLANYSEGVFDPIDKWIWDGVMLGQSWIRLRWEEQRETFVAVEPVIDEMGQPVQDPETGEDQYQEVLRERELVYAGPVLENISPLNFYIPAGSRIETADPIIVRLFKTKDELRKLKKIKHFWPDKVDDLLETSPTNDRFGESEKNVIQIGDELEGKKSVDANLERKGYNILECTTLFDVNDDGIDEKIIVWMEERSRIILGWTFAHRVSIGGRAPYYGFTFVPRDRVALGLVEMLKPLNDEVDILRNTMLDSGALLNMAWGTCKESRSLKADDVKVGPGVFLPVQDHDDIQIKSVPANMSFFIQQEGVARKDAELLGLSQLAFGQTPDTVGSLGTATGTMSMLNESNKIVSIHIKRLQKSWGALLRGIYHLLREKLPADTIFRVTGEDGKDFTDRVVDRRFFLSDVDFYFAPNTASLNKELDKQQAIMAHQVLLNPLHLQTGVVGPQHIIKSLKDVLIALGKNSAADYVNEQIAEQQPLRTVEEEVSYIIQGLMPPIALQDDHQKKIQGLEFFLNSPDMKHYSKEKPQLHMTFTRLFQQAIDAHMQMLQAIQAQAQQSNVAGLEIAPTQMSRMAGSGDSTSSPAGQGAPLGSGSGGTSPNVTGGQDSGEI